MQNNPNPKRTTDSANGGWLHAVVSCPRCKSRGKEWEGSDPKCAFATGVFDPNNWNCATANALREICERRPEQWNNCDDQHACLLSGIEDSFHVLLHWYKSRGRTEGAWMVTMDGEMKPLTLAEAERVVAANVSDQRPGDRDATKNTSSGIAGFAASDG